MTSSETSTAPAEIVTQQIMDRLVNESLLTVELATKIQRKFADGKMQTADWKLVFEEALDLHKRQPEQSC